MAGLSEKSPISNTGLARATGAMARDGSGLRPALPKRLTKALRVCRLHGVAPFHLARANLDPGLFSDNWRVMRDYYVTTVGLPFMERLEHSPTYAEQFFELPEGKLKIQSFDEPMDVAVTGYRQLYLARPGRSDVIDLVDPDGLPVRLVPPGHRGVTNVGVVCAVADVEAQRRFIVAGMGGTETDDGFQVGSTKIFVRHEPDQPRSTPPMRRGFTYITLIVHDIENCHRALLDAG